MNTAASEQQEAVLIELTGNKLNPIRRFRGTLDSVAGKSLTFSSPEQIAALSHIRVQGKDLLFLGDVVQSIPVEDGLWSVRMHISSKLMIF